MLRSITSPVGQLVGLLVGLAVATAACALPGGGDSTPLGPVEAVRLIDAPASTHLLSPDGRWVAAAGESGAEVCLTPTDGSSQPVCADGAGGSIGTINWSPDSQAVVVLPDVLRRLEVGPVVVLGVDGSRTEVAGPAPLNEVFGSPIDAVFDGTNRIVYLVPQEEPSRLEVRRVGADGSSDELLATFEASGDDHLIPDPGVVLDGRKLYFSLSFGDDGEQGVWRFDLVTGDREPVVVGRAVLDDNGFYAGEHVVAVHGDLLLTVDLFLMAERRDDGDHLQIRTADGMLTTVSDRAGFEGMTAAFSPDGSQIAVVSRPSDSTIDAMRVSVATVASVLAETPEWHDLDVEGRLFPELGSGLARVIWTDDDRLVIGTTEDGIVSIELGPVD